MELHLASAAACADGSAVHRDAQPLVALRAADLIAGGASEPLTIPLPHTRAFGPLRALLLRLRLGCRFRLRHRFRLGFRFELGLRFRIEAFLTHNRDWRIRWMMAHLLLTRPEEVHTKCPVTKEAMQKGEGPAGGCFWMEKVN